MKNYQNINARMVIILLPFLFLTSCSSNEIKKKSIIAGYKDGSIIDYRFMMYEDSTYYLSTINSIIGYESNFKWTQNNDTILLHYNDTIGAKIHNAKLIDYYLPEFRCLGIMEIKAFTPAKIIKFPKNK